MSTTDIFQAAEAHLIKDTQDFLFHPEIVEVEARIERLQALAFRLVKEVEASADTSSIAKQNDAHSRRAVAIFNKAQTEGDHISIAETQARKEEIALLNDKIVHGLKRDIEELVARYHDNPAHAEILANKIISMDMAEIDRMSVDFALWTKHHCELAWSSAVKRLEEIADLVDA